MVKSLCENDFIFNGIINCYLNKLTIAFFNNLPFLHSYEHNCFSLYFMIFKFFCSKAREEFNNSLKNIFNGNYLMIYTIFNYMDNAKYKNDNNFGIKEKMLNESFIRDLGQILNENDVKKGEFADKYAKIIRNM